MKRVILDLRGLVLHGFYADKHNLTMSVMDGDTRVPAAGHAVNLFLDRYLIPILKQVPPTKVIAVLEGKDGNARRRGVLPDYKDKPEQDADSAVIAEQKAIALKVVSKLLLHVGCMTVSNPYCEADDTIAYLVERLKGELDVYTVDQDLLAAYRPGVTFYCTDRSVGQPEVKTTFKGFDLSTDSPKLITLWKSIVGDSSDNIKGVVGMGEAKILKLATDFGFDGLEQLADIVDTKNWDALTEACAGAPESKELVMLWDKQSEWRRSWHVAKLHPEWCDTTYRGKMAKPIWSKRLPLRAKALAELEEAGVGYRIDDLEDHFVQMWAMDKTTIDHCRANGSYADYINELLRSEFVGYDWESFDEHKHPNYREIRKDFVDTLSQRLTGGSFCFGPNHQYCFYVPIAHRDTANMSPEYLKGILMSLQRGTPMVAHNAMFEMVVALTNFEIGPNPDNYPHDTAISATYVDENTRTSLKYLSKHYLNYDQLTYRQIVPEGMDMSDLSVEEVLHYGCDDSIVASHLHILFRTICETEGTWDFVNDEERSFYPAHLVPFIKGIPVDFKRMKELEEADWAQFAKDEAELRPILAEHCRKPLGGQVLWDEVREFESKKALDKGKPIGQKKLDEKKTELLQLCSYADFGPPEVSYTRQALSDAARAIGLPAYRAHDWTPQKLAKWYESVVQQAQEAGVDFTQAQEDLLNAMGSGDQEELLAEVQKIHNEDRSLWVGTELNVTSPKQMAGMLYGMLGLPVCIRNDVDEGSARDMFEMAGAPSTNNLAVQTWMTMVPHDGWQFRVLQLLLSMRAVKQRHGLYYRPYPLWASPVTGRIHPQFRNCGTVTHRPSGSSPNLLQVSKTKDDGRIRSCLMSQSFDILVPGAEPEVVVSIDWAQQELAILAAVSRDPNLLACYVGQNTKDVHTTTSVAIANILARREGRDIHVNYNQYESLRKNKDEIGKWLDEVRGKKGKPTNFLMVYGGSPVGLARKLIVDQDLATEIFRGFHHTYPGVEERQRVVVEFAEKHGYVTTMYGNRRHCPEIISRDKQRASGAARQAVNMEMQGTAADILKMTLTNYLKQDVEGKTRCTLMANVYDEVVASVPVSKVKTYIDLMTDIMAVRLPSSDVVLKTEASIGLRAWAPQVELKGDHSQENINRVIGELLG